MAKSIKTKAKVKRDLTDREKTSRMYSALDKYYKDSSRFVAQNIYYYQHEYGETDYLVVGRKDFIYDIEVKVSKSDFKKDSQKISKHEILSEGKYTLTKGKAVRSPETGRYVQHKKGEKVPADHSPNRFYYAVPKGLIKVEDIPDYAGLIEIDLNTLELVKTKEAKLLTRKLNRALTNEILVMKFYHRCK